MKSDYTADNINLWLHYYLSQWNDVRNGVEEELVPVLGAELRQGEAQDVEDVVEEVVDGQRTHQRMEVSHYLQMKKNWDSKVHFMVQGVSGIWAS